MTRKSNYLSLIVVLLAVLSATAAGGQSLNIFRDDERRLRVEANSSEEVGFRLQASSAWQDWEDISDQASGPFSFRIGANKVENRFFRLRTWNTQDAPITLILIGDSTVADFAVNNSQFSGWGQGIYGYLKPNVRVINLALALQSTKVFLTSIQKDYLVNIKPDFVLIHFGWVDASDWPPPHHTTVAEYGENLKTIVEITREFKGTPILMTPANPRFFDASGKIIPFVADRCKVVRDLSVELQTYLIDLNQLTTNLYNELGETKSAYITWSDSDRAHFTLKGAEVISGLVVDSFPAILRPQVVKN